MNESIIAVRYAKALHQLAQEKNVLQEVYKDMSNILDISSEIKELQSFLDSPIIKPSKKIEISSSIFSSYNNLTTTFLNTLYTNRRESILTDVARKYTSMINNERSITVATVITTTSLQNDTKEKIIKLIGHKYHSNTVELNEKIDEKIIGGFIIKVNDEQFDASISTQLSSVKRKLLKTPVK